MTPEFMRLFVAAPVPANIRSRIADFARELNKRMPAEAVRWTPEEQIHLTLKFLGKVETTALPELQAALNSATDKTQEMEMEACELGAFPSARNPRVIWIGLKGDLQSLLELQERVAEASAPWCEKEENRRFSPHLTIGRVREPQSRTHRRIAAALRFEQQPGFGNWPATEIVLMRSQLSPHGATHTLIKQFQLQGRR